MCLSALVYFIDCCYCLSLSLPVLSHQTSKSRLRFPWVWSCQRLLPGLFFLPTVIQCCSKGIVAFLTYQLRGVLTPADWRPATWSSTLQNRRVKRLRSDLFVMHTHGTCPPLSAHPGWHLLTHTCTCHPSSCQFTNLLSSESGDQTTNLQVIIGWPTVTTEPRPPPRKLNAPAPGEARTHNLGIALQVTVLYTDRLRHWSLSCERS